MLTSTCRRLAARSASLATARPRLLSTKPPPPSSSSSSSSSAASTRPTAEEVKELAESAKFQERMWNTFAPERSVRFGDQRFWVLVGIVGGLHLWNNMRDAQKVANPDADLPEGAARRLPDGRLLMVDGSISAPGTEVGVTHAPTLHKTADVNKGVIHNIRNKVSDAA